MANLSVSGAPLWLIKAGLARERKNLEDFESGRLRMGRRSVDGPWQNVTEQWVTNQRRIIETFESVLAAFEKEKAH
jgi:hypothetical protein